MTDIIELIDNAIDDCLSPDAMRWSPDSQPERAADGYTIIDETYVWTSEMARTFAALLESAYLPNPDLLPALGAS